MTESLEYTEARAQALGDTLESILPGLSDAYYDLVTCIALSLADKDMDNKDHCRVLSKILRRLETDNLGIFPTIEDV